MPTSTTTSPPVSLTFYQIMSSKIQSNHSTNAAQLQQDKVRHASEEKEFENKWTMIPGAIGWARRPFHHHHKGTHESHVSHLTNVPSLGLNKDNEGSAPTGTWRPVILYRNWSYAITSSGFFESFNSDTQTSHCGPGSKTKGRDKSISSHKSMQNP